MNKFVFLLLFYIPVLIVSSQPKYYDSHSCKECHETIYEEYKSSMHSRGYFSDELHRKIADKVGKSKYDCASCHMPAADNIDDLISGKSRPDKGNKTHTDAISCYFCHTIAYVKKAHRFNINTKARQAKDYKPTYYGRLTNPDENDRHSSVKNPVYTKNVCKGCHSHKLNENNVTIFRAMDEKQDSESCVECHMPMIAGGAENMDKRARGRHVSHKFRGIHNDDMRKKSVDINISYSADKLHISIVNKMDHPLIIQPARAKYLKIRVLREGKVIWQNFKKDPAEDPQGYFALSFKREGRKIIIPATATEQGRVNNLAAREKRELEYRVPNLKKGDIIEVAMYVKFAKDDCMKEIDLDDNSFNSEILMKKIRKTL